MTLFFSLQFWFKITYGRWLNDGTILAPGSFVKNLFSFGFQIPRVRSVMSNKVTLRRETNKTKDSDPKIKSSQHTFKAAVFFH